MTDGFELDSERVEPKSGVVVTRVLRKVLGSMYNATAATYHVVMNSIDKRPARNPTAQPNCHRLGLKPRRLR